MMISQYEELCKMDEFGFKNVLVAGAKGKQAQILKSLWHGLLICKESGDMTLRFSSELAMPGPSRV